MRLKWLLSVLMAVTLLPGASALAGSPAKAKAKKKAANSTAVESSGNSDSPAAQKAQASKPAASKPAANTATEPPVTPVAATTGTLGLFTIETGETLPKGGWSFDGYANKFGRMPASVTILQWGLNVGYGITDRLDVYAGFLPDEHLHISSANPAAQLSFDVPQGSQPLFGNTFYRRLGANQTPGYVEDYPFAGHNGGGVGPVVVGVKYGFLSQRSGAPVSLSLRNDFIIPTVQSGNSLLQNGTQTGQFNDQLGLAVSRNFGHNFLLTGDVDFRFTRDPKYQGVVAMQQAQQLLGGAGFIVFPEKRIQLMNEYTALVFTGGHTPDDTFSDRDPIDGVWGVRFYPNHMIAVDAGYRYMLNLTNDVDRSGFVIKVGATLWPRKPAPPPPPPPQPPSAACSEDKPNVVAGSNGNIAVTARATDPQGFPLNYSWSATGGQVNGNGPQVQWVPGNAAPGNYTVSVTVDNGHNLTAMCSVNARVDPRPLRPPTVTLSADRNNVLVGERVHFTANGADPQNFPLNYNWTTNGGMLNASGTAGDLDTTGVAPGNYTVTVRVDNAHGGAADASQTIAVAAPPPPPQAVPLTGCDFKAVNSARVDNVCKRVLDDAAVRLQNAPGSTLVIIGYADPKERGSAKLSGDRAGNAAAYLGTKGIDRSRINTRTGTGQTGAGQANRHADVIFVPQGATY